MYARVRAIADRVPLEGFMSASQFDTPCTATSKIYRNRRADANTAKGQGVRAQRTGGALVMLLRGVIVLERWAFVSPGTTECYSVVRITQEFWIKLRPDRSDITWSMISPQVDIRTAKKQDNIIRCSDTNADIIITLPEWLKYVQLFITRTSQNPCIIIANHDICSYPIVPMLSFDPS